MTPDDYIDTVPDLEPHVGSGMLGYGPFHYRYVDRLPKASIGKSCVRLKRTADVDRGVLRELIAEAGRIGPAAEA